MNNQLIIYRLKTQNKFKFYENHKNVPIASSIINKNIRLTYDSLDTAFNNAFLN